MKKAIIFDLDDTLIAEIDYIKSGYKHIARFLSDKHNLNECDLYGQLLSLFHDSPMNVFNRVLEANKIAYTEDNIQELVQKYRNHNPDIEFYPDVENILRILKNEGYKLGLITDGYANAQRKKLAAISANQYFDEIIVTDELAANRKYWKPHTRAYDLMSTRLDTDFSDMLYVGDNPEKDFYIGKTRHIRTVRLTIDEGVHKDKEYKEGIKEDYKITEIGELVSVIEDWGY